MFFSSSAVSSAQVVFFSQQQNRFQLDIVLVNLYPPLYSSACCSFGWYLASLTRCLTGLNSEMTTMVARLSLTRCDVNNYDVRMFVPSKIPQPSPPIIRGINTIQFSSLTSVLMALPEVEGVTATQDRPDIFSKSPGPIVSSIQNNITVSSSVLDIVLVNLYPPLHSLACCSFCWFFGSSRRRKPLGAWCQHRTGQTTSVSLQYLPFKATKPFPLIRSSWSWWLLNSRHHSWQSQQQPAHFRIKDNWMISADWFCLPWLQCFVPKMPESRTTSHET